MDQRRGGRPSEHYNSLEQPSAFKGHKKILTENSNSSVLKDPRLSHDKYRAQIMKNKHPRISPDTTQDKKNTFKEPLDTNMKMPKNAKFRCSLCASDTFEAITEVRKHLQSLHAIEGQEVWDPLTKIPKFKYLKAYKCKACPPTARYENRFFFCSFETLSNLIG